MKIDKFITHFDYFEQRDILAILVNLLSLDKTKQDENSRLFDTLLEVSSVDKADTLQLIIQEEKIKYYYELIILDEMKISVQKYLNLILEDIYQNSNSIIYKEKIEFIISKFIYDDTIKEEIKNYVNTLEVNKDIKLISYGYMKNEILNNSLKPLKKKKSFSKKVKEKFVHTLAFSSDVGDYGIKELSIGRSDTIHIFINGFTNDTKNDNFKDWMQNTKNILNQNDTFLGYDWASGKDPTSIILDLPNINEVIKKPAMILKYARGLNPTVIGGTIFVQTVSEWKQAKYNSEKYSESLAQSINNYYNKNKMLKINLYGHSLGANLIHNALEHLTSDEIKVNNIYLFGGASLNNSRSWTHSLCVTNNIYNFYSKNDYVLSMIYQVIEMGNEPIGISEIKVNNINNLNMGKIYNYNVSDIVNGHSEYIKNFSEFSLRHCESD